MGEQRFWLVGNRGRVAVITDQAQAARVASDGLYGGVYRCDGPFVPESELARAVDALRDIAKVDHIDAVLDPTRPLRIAKAWLREHTPGGQS